MKALCFHKIIKKYRPTVFYSLYKDSKSTDVRNECFQRHHQAKMRPPRTSENESASVTMRIHPSLNCNFIELVCICLGWPVQGAGLGCSLLVRKASRT